MPIAGLPVDRLVTLEELGADPPRRKTPPSFYDQRDAQNAARESETRAKVVVAIAAMTAAGETITAAAVARRAGIRRQTISENATLRTLVDQAQPKAETVTQGVRASSVNTVYGTDQARTPQVTDPSPPWIPPDDPEITPVRERSVPPITRGSAMKRIAQTPTWPHGWWTSRERAVAIPSRNHAPYPHGHRWRPPDAKPADRTTLPALQTALPRFITRQKASWLPDLGGGAVERNGSTGRVCHCFVSDSSYRDAGYLIVLCSGRLEQYRGENLAWGRLGHWSMGGSRKNHPGLKPVRGGNDHDCISACEPQPDRTRGAARGTPAL